MEHAAQHVMALAYISRHRLAWRAEPSGRREQRFILVQVPPRDEDWDKMPRGFGYSLYEAVLDYQENTGIGWGA